MTYPYLIHLFLLAFVVSCEIKAQDPGPVNQDDINLILPYAHSASIASTAFSSDGTYLVSGDVEGWLKVWELATGVPVMTIKAHLEGIDRVHFSSDRDYYSVSTDGILKKWEIGTNKPISTLGTIEEKVLLLDIAPSGDLAVLYYEDQYRLWNLNQWQWSKSSISHSLEMLPPYEKELKFSCSADLKYLSYSNEEKLELFDLKNGKTLFTKVLEQGESITPCTFSKDDKYFAFNTTDQFSYIDIFNIEEGVLERRLTFRDLIPNMLYVNTVDAISFVHDDSDFLVTAGMDMKIRLWEVSTGHEITNYQPEDMITELSELGFGGISSLQVAPSDQYFVAAKEQILSIWPLRSYIQKKEVAEPGNALICAEIHQNPDIITIAYDNGRIAEINSVTGKEVSLIRSSGSSVKSLRILDEHLVFVILENGQWEVYNSREGKLVFKYPANRADGADFKLAANHQFVVMGPEYKKNAIFPNAEVQILSTITGEKLGAIPGFSSGVREIAVSYDGRYIAFAGDKQDDGQSSQSIYIRVWSTEKQQFLADTRVGYSTNVQNLEFSQDGNRLMVLTPIGQIQLLDVKFSRWIGSVSLMSSGPISYNDELARGDITFISFGNTGELSSSKQVEYWDTENWRDETTPYRINVPEEVADLHPIHEQLLFGYSGGGLLVVNLKLSLRGKVSGRSIQSNVGPPVFPSYYRSTQSYLNLHDAAVLDARMSDDNEVANSIGADSQFKKSDFFVDEQELPSLYQWSTVESSPEVITTTGDTEVFIGKMNGDLLRYDLTSVPAATLIKNVPEGIKTLTSDLQKKWLAICDKKNNLVLFDLHSRAEYLLEDKNLYDNPEYDRLLFSPEGKYLLGVSEQNNDIYIWDVVNRKYLNKLIVRRSLSAVAFSPDEQQVIVGYAIDQMDHKSNADYFDIKSGDLIHTISNQTGTIHSIADLDGQQIAWFVDSNKVTARLLTKRTSVLKEVLSLDLPQGALEQIRFIDDGQRVQMIVGEYAYIKNGETGEDKILMEEELQQLKRYLSTADDTSLPDGWVLQITPRRAIVHSDDDQKVTIWPIQTDHKEVYMIDGSYLLLSNESGLLHWLDGKKGEVVLTSVLPNGSSFINYTPDYYYYASRQLASGLHYSNGSKAFGFDQFDLIYNRPDIVIQSFREGEGASLAEIFKLAYEKRLTLMGWNEGSTSTIVDIPSVNLVSSENNVVVKERDFEFTFQANSTSSSLGKIQLLVNDVPLYGRVGLPIDPNQNSLVKTVNLPLTAGRNVIKVIAYNEQGIVSNPVSFSVFCEVPEKLPNLYLITIGVSDYRAAGKDLKFAAKDAMDVANLYQDSKAFQQVYTKTLTDQQVTKANILALHKWLEDTSVDDQVILYVSGHGLLDDRYNFYFGTHNIDFANPLIHGILFDEVEGLLDGIPARQKLLLIDACYSGEYDQEASRLTPAQVKALAEEGISFQDFAKGNRGGPVLGLQSSFEMMQRLFADLRRSSGAIVITSSSGLQVSYENGEWKNGAFTYAFLYGLKTMKADANQDGRITASEIQTFVAEIVPRLTEGLQIPTFRRENLAYDFRVW